MKIPKSSEIVTSILDSVEQRINAFQISALPVLRSLVKGVINMLAITFAPSLHSSYIYADWALAQTDPQTADDADKVDGGRLQSWGILLKVGLPKPGQAPQYEIEISGDNGAALLAGTQYVSDNGNLYLLAADIVIAGGVATGTIKASVAADGLNTDYTLPLDAQLNTINPYPGILNPAIVTSELVPATDKEDIEIYRDRVVFNFLRPPEGGSRADFARWPLDAEGVQRAYPYADIVDAGLITVYIEATADIDPDGIPTGAVLDAAEAAIQVDPETGIAREPLAGTFTVEPISLKLFDVIINGLVSDDDPAAEDAITTALTMYFKNKRPFLAGVDFLTDKNDIVSRAEALSVAVGAIKPYNGVITDLDLESGAVPIDSYTLDDGEKSKMDSIAFV